MLLDRLARLLEQEQAELSPYLLAQIFLLYQALENPDSPRIPVLATALTAQAMTSFARSFGLAAEEQFKSLRRRPGTVLAELQQAPVREFGVIMRSRVVTVLSKPQTEKQLAAYSRTLSDVSVTFGARAGFETVGAASGARFKTFARVRAAREPRQHSVNEGRTILVSQNWNLNGYKVVRPADVSLPLSERLRCSHVNLFS